MSVKKMLTRLRIPDGFRLSEQSVIFSFAKKKLSRYITSLCDVHPLYFRLSDGLKRRVLTTIGSEGFYT